MRLLALLAAFALVSAVAADDKPAVRLIPAKDLKVTFPARPIDHYPAVVASADDLAKSPVVKGAADELGKQIDFAKEKLVVLAWSGSAKDGMAAELKSDGGKNLAVFTLTVGSAKQPRDNIRLYAVPKDAEVKVGKNPKVPKGKLSPVAADDKPAVRALDLKDVKLVLPERLTEPKPAEIKSAEELAKAKEFTDDAGRDAVAKQVNFAKEKLVVFAWAGSGQDKLTPDLVTDGKSAKVTFAYKVGATDDFVRHARVFAVPKDAKVEVTR